MTVETTHISESLQADGAELHFEFSFRCNDTGAVKVYVNGEAVSPLIYLNDDQVVTPGGHVTFEVPPVAGAVVELRRVTPATQLTVLDPYNKFPSDAVEAALDAGVMRDQELAAKLDAFVGGGGQVDIAGAEITPVGSLLTRTLAAWLSRLDPEGGPIPVTASGGTKNTLAGWMAQLVEVTAAVTELGGVVGGGGTAPTGNRIGAGTLAERDAITDWTAGDLWFDTADSWHPYRFDGLAWVDIINPTLATRNRTFVQPDAPTNPANGVPLVDGDIWFDDDAGYAISRWSGTAWESVRDTGTIDASRLLGTIPVARLADGSIDAAKLAAAMKGDGSTPVAWLAANAIGANHIIANAILAGHIRSGSVTADKIDALAVTAGKIAAGAVQAAHIAANQITTSHLAFTPVQPGNIIAFIRSSAEGLLIQGSRIDIAGNATFQALDAAKANANLSNVTTIDGGKLSADSIKTNDYQATGTGAAEVATRGARLRNNAATANGGAELPAILASPAGIKIGAKTLDQTWLAQGQVHSFHLRHYASSTSVGVYTFIGRSPLVGSCDSSGNIVIPVGIPNAMCSVVLNGLLSTNAMVQAWGVDETLQTDGAGNLTIGLMNSGGGHYGVEVVNANWHATLMVVIAGSSFN